MRRSEAPTRWSRVVAWVTGAESSTPKRPLARPTGTSRTPPQPAAAAIDWKAYLALAWVLWFGLLYGRMVVQRRGARLRELITRTAAHPDPARPVRR